MINMGEPLEVKQLNLFSHNLLTQRQTKLGVWFKLNLLSIEIDLFLDLFFMVGRLSLD